MTLPLTIAVAQWLFAAVFGLVVLSVVRAPVRHRLWPAAPAIGLGTAVVVLSATSVLVPTGLAAPLIAALVLVAAVVQAVRHRADLRPHIGTGLAVLAATLLAGTVGFAFAVAPAHRTDAGTVMATGNNDAFYYASVAEWLVEHPVTVEPEVTHSPSEGDDPPATGPAHSALRSDLRLGDTLLSASASSLAGVPVSHFWTWQVVSWLLVLPASFAGAARLLSRRPDPATWWGLAAGAVVAASPLVTWQVHNQNSASVLGLVQVPLALALWWSGVAAEGDDPGNRPPRWLVALVLSGTLGSYSEYAPVVAIAFGISVIARPPRAVPAALVRAVTTVALAVAVAPAIWWRLVSSLLFQGGLANEDWPSPYHDAPAGRIVARLVGATSPVGDSATDGLGSLGLVLVVVISVGLGIVLWRHPSRWLWAGFAAGAVVTALYLALGAENLYSQQRVVEITQPVLLGLAVMGWGLLASDTSRPRSPLRWGLAVAVVPALLLGASARIQRALLLPEHVIEERAVDDDFRDVATWAEEYGGDEGGELTVLVPAYVDLMWATDALRPWDDTSYLLLYPDYHLRSAYIDSCVTRYLITGRSTPVGGLIDDAVVDANDRFRLLDRAAAPLDVIAPGAGFHHAEGSVDDPSFWMSAIGEIVIVRSVDGPATLTFEATTLPDLGDVPLRVTVDGDDTVAEVVVPAEGGRVEVPLPSSRWNRVAIESLDGARPPSATPDPRELSVYLGDFSVEPQGQPADGAPFLDCPDGDDRRTS